MSEQIEYEITLKVKVPAGQPDAAPTPFEDGFYACCEGDVQIERAKRITPATNYGGPK